ncbi:hypothetical protein PR202_ga12272 [Eleusine coracana subsp. coracana]|uniref:Uncharacterized protein n=1 Tax=Eleusine coracana subsp. coracana TaxID=191504 RepID=A0AAV5CBC5_ELECO|nr:hypothetical protein PR202_ga12272 [Eleusine coracana subsp. coracana]
MEQPSQAQARKEGDGGGEGMPRSHTGDPHGEAAAQAKQGIVGEGEREGVVRRAVEREAEKAVKAEEETQAAAMEGRPRPLPHWQVPQPKDVYDERLERL